MQSRTPNQRQERIRRDSVATTSASVSGISHQPSTNHLSNRSVSSVSDKDSGSLHVPKPPNMHQPTLKFKNNARSNSRVVNIISDGAAIERKSFQAQKSCSSYGTIDANFFEPSSSSEVHALTATGEADPEDADQSTGLNFSQEYLKLRRIGEIDAENSEYEPEDVDEMDEGLAARYREGVSGTNSAIDIGMGDGRKVSVVVQEADYGDGIELQANRFRAKISPDNIFMETPAPPTEKKRF